MLECGDLVEWIGREYVFKFGITFEGICEIWGEGDKIDGLSFADFMCYGRDKIFYIVRECYTW